MTTRYALLVARYMQTTQPGSGWGRAESETLGEQIAQAVADREASLTNWSTIPPSSDHLAHVAALQAIRAQAEEETLHELLYQAYPPPETDQTEADQTESENESSWVLQEQKEAAALLQQLRLTSDDDQTS